MSANRKGTGETEPLLVTNVNSSFFSCADSNFVRAVPLNIILQLPTEK